MLSLTTSAPTSVARQVLRTIGQLRLNLPLSREMCFDLLDIVDSLLDLEQGFHITIPDEVPLITVSDFVDYVVAVRPFRRGRR